MTPLQAHILWSQAEKHTKYTLTVRAFLPHFANERRTAECGFLNDLQIFPIYSNLIGFKRGQNIKK